MTPHDGKGAPAHLPEGAAIHVKYRDGQRGVITVARYEHGDSAQFDDWTWDGSDCDIIAYKEN